MCVAWLGAQMACGDKKACPKGGRPEYRNGPQYELVFGKRQGDRMKKKNEKACGKRFASASARSTWTPPVPIFLLLVLQISSWSRRSRWPFAVTMVETQTPPLFTRSPEPQSLASLQGHFAAHVHRGQRDRVRLLAQHDQRGVLSAAAAHTLLSAGHRSAR